jgi:general secretion pathway protein J
VKTFLLRRRVAHGFTLIELMVALFVMALMAVLGWQGLDGMVRTQARTQERADAVLSLQVGLAQWNGDLQAIVQVPQVTALDWNGRVLRLTRRGAGDAGDALVVAAWTRRGVEGRDSWLRWSSPPLRTRAEVDEAWRRADLWSQSPGDADRAREALIVPLDDWQIYFHRGGTWTNPQSSDATFAPSQAPNAAAPVAAGAAPGASRQATTGELPDGVRLVLQLPASEAIGGTLTTDWVSPRVGGTQ